MGNIIIAYVLTFIAAYFIGSIPTGYIVVKKLKGVDIRKTGSGSTGATNVKRILGTKWFFVVLLIDGIKGILAVMLAYKFSNNAAFYTKSGDLVNLFGLGAVICAFAAILGHSKSIFLGLTGGKSVATGIGTLLAINLNVGLIATAVWAVIAFFTKFVSLGSIVAVTLAAILMMWWSDNIYYTCFTALCAVFIILTHRQNIIRLIQGKENKVRK